MRTANFSLSCLLPTLFTFFSNKSITDIDSSTTENSSTVVEIGDIIISGNKKTKSFIILREVPFKKGESYPLNELVKKFEDAQNREFVGHVTVLAFLGEDLLNYKTNALNLNEKIYKNFYGYPDFQMIVLMPVGTEAKVSQLSKELGATSDIEKWYFVFKEKSEIDHIFKSLDTPFTLDDARYTPYAFIIDRNADLRGRNDDEDEAEGLLYGYNAETVALIHQKMVDDMKVLMAEYRLALKSNKREI